MMSDEPTPQQDLQGIRERLLEQIADDMEALPPQPDEEHRHTDSKQLPPKRVLIDRIHDLCDKQGIARTQCKSWTKPRLVQHLGEMVNGGLDSRQAEEDQHIAQQMVEEIEPADNTPKPTHIDPDQGAVALYRLNELVGSLISGIAEKEVKPRCGWSLPGFTTRLRDSKQDLIQCYREIYDEYGADLSPYLSATNRVMLINLNAGYQSLQRDGEVEKTD
jgi:hypothetical protein